MKLMAFFNRDGGTFRTTDMEAYERHAETVFADAGHELECHVVGRDEIVSAMELAARRDNVDAIIAGGGDGTCGHGESIGGEGAVGKFPTKAYMEVPRVSSRRCVASLGPTPASSCLKNT